MAALVQTYTPQTATVAMLHTRPNSASGMLQSHQGQQYSQSQSSSQPRNNYHGLQGGMGGQIVYRGSVGPVQPYAFTSTPSLNQTAQWQPPMSYRASSTSAVPTIQSLDHSHNGGRSRYLASASMTNLPTSSTLGLSMGGSRDDSSIPGTATRRTATTFTPPQGTPAKPSPERYRRSAPRSTDSQQTEQQRRNSFVGAIPGSMASEDLQPNGVFSAEEAARRVRRRSLPALDSADFPKPLTPLQFDLVGNKQPEESKRLEQPSSSQRPKSAGKEHQQKPAQNAHHAANDAAAVQKIRPVHGRTGSADSRTSIRSNGSRPSSVSLPGSVSLLHGSLSSLFDPSISLPFPAYLDGSPLHDSPNHALSIPLFPCRLLQSLTKRFSVCEPQYQWVGPHRKPRLVRFRRLKFSSDLIQS
jgi:hypothetical protein